VRVAVVGLGRIGLPLAVQYASRGHQVLGCDINRSLVDRLNSGECPYDDEADLESKLAQTVAAGQFHATTDTTAAVSRSDTVVVIVPLTIHRDGSPDFGPLDSATAAVAAGLTAGTLVSFETTMPVGTTRQRLLPALEKSGLQAGRDFWLIHSPERVLVGRVFEDLARYPKALGGVDPESTQRGMAFYTTVLDHMVQVRDAETAEMIKLAETAFRDVNIAIANQLALYAAETGVDISEVIPIANSQPFSNILHPGVGVGGHCIPVYPHFIISNSEYVPLLRAAREVNDHMSSHALSLVRSELGTLQGKRIAILGLSFRENVKQATYSVAERLIEELRQAGATVLVHDPQFNEDELRAYGVEPAPLEHQPVPVDAAILQTAHREYRDGRLLANLAGCRLFVDGRNALDRGTVESLGLKYVGIGRPASLSPTSPRVSTVSA